ncbi:MAG: RNA-binding protein [Halobacteriales archaeon]
MASVPLHYIDLRAFCYATEDEERVRRALRTFLPEEYDIDREKNEGHHGDRIVVLSTRVENADDIRHVLDQVRRLDDLETIRSELDERVDENCSLFLQFDKQAAYRGAVTTGAGIMLRAKVEAYPARKETAVENARSVLAAEA